MADTNVQDEPELLNGAAAIAGFFGWPIRRVYYLHHARRLPCVFQIGDRLCMRPATGRAWLAKMEHEQLEMAR